MSEAARIHYRSNGDFAVPLVVRAPWGGGVHGALYHSQSIEATYAHIPGLKVVVPSTPADVCGMLRTAIDDADPVLFLEHKKTYRLITGLVPDDDAWRVPIGLADVAREGDDLTVVTYGLHRHLCLEAAEAVAESDGASVEVVDLRTISPLDRDTVLASVAKTGRCLVVHEDNISFGVGAEVAAIVAEEAFWDLDAPVRRLATADVPSYPFAGPLEGELFIDTAKIVDAILASLARADSALVGEAEVGGGHQRTEREALRAGHGLHGAAAVDDREQQHRLGAALLADHLGRFEHRHAAGDGVLGDHHPVAGLQRAGDPAAAAVVLHLLADAEAPQLAARVAAMAAMPKATASAPIVRPPMAVTSSGMTSSAASATRSMPSARQVVCLASMNHGLLLPLFSVKSPVRTLWASRWATRASWATVMDAPLLEPHVAVPGRDPPDLGGAVALGAEQVERAVRLVGRDHHHHADAEVEDLAHLVVGDLAEALDLAEDARRLPRARVDDRRRRPRGAPVTRLPGSPPPVMWAMARTSTWRSSAAMAGA